MRTRQDFICISFITFTPHSTDDNSFIITPELQSSVEDKYRLHYGSTCTDRVLHSHPSYGIRTTVNSDESIRRRVRQFCYCSIRGVPSKNEYRRLRQYSYYSIIATSQPNGPQSTGIPLGIHYLLSSELNERRLSRRLQQYFQDCIHGTDNG